MLYEVINTLTVGKNTAVMIAGSGKGLKNNIFVTGASGKKYRIISIGMASGIDPDEIGKTTDLLIEGKFNEKQINF